MTLYLTAYAMGGGTYGEYIEAESREDAMRLAGLRGLNERIEGETPGSSLVHTLALHIKRQDWLKAAHSATQLCFIGLSAGALTPRECFGDTGLVHELLHLASSSPEADESAEDKRERKAVIRRVRDTAREFEWRVPGWPPSFTGQPGVIVRVRGKIDQQRTEGLPDG